MNTIFVNQVNIENDEELEDFNCFLKEEIKNQ